MRFLTVRDIRGNLGLVMFRTRLTLKPGAPGTQQLVNEYGACLVCVRYRYDETRKMRIKTIELIVDERPWTPSSATPDPMDYVHVQLSPDETHTRDSIKRLGGSFFAETKTWRVTYAAATILHLTDRIVPSTAA